MDQHLRYLDECAELHENAGKNVERGGTTTDPLKRLCILNPDLMLEIAKVLFLFVGLYVVTSTGVNAVYAAYLRGSYLMYRLLWFDSMLILSRLQERCVQCVYAVHYHCLATAVNGVGGSIERETLTRTIVSGVKCVAHA